MAALFVLGVLLTQFVEYVVLNGDIGRMNTVFKFYIQIWLVWAALAAVAVAWLMPYVRGFVWWPADRRQPAAAAVAAESDVAPDDAEPPPPPVAPYPAAPAPRAPRTAWLGAVWLGAFALLVLSGLTYTVTAARAKIEDRWTPVGDMSEAERAEFQASLVPSLSGIDYQRYARYDDDNHFLRLARDGEAIQWLLRNVPGTPTILEGFREAAYRWGSRYSINTGLPTVIGWDWHQKQQRNAVGAHWIDERVADVREMYDSTDVARTEELLDHYGVDYIIVGEMERAFYNPAGIAKFDQMTRDGRLEQVYPTPDMADTPVRIYRRAGRQASAP
jgi:uncharacterized membrane protein